MKRTCTVLTAALLIFLFHTTDVAAQQDFEQDHYEATYELFEVLNMEELLQDSIHSSLTMFASQDPQMEVLLPVFIRFMEETFKWEDMRDQFAHIYLETFTAEEIREITGFMRTETGLKFSKNTTTLMQKGSELGMQMVMQNEQKLERMIMEFIEAEGF